MQEGSRQQTYRTVCAKALTQEGTLPMRILKKRKEVLREEDAGKQGQWLDNAKPYKRG